MIASKMPSWARWASFIIFIAGTWTAVVMWAGEAHSNNRSGVIENRSRLDDTADDLKRIETKLDRLIMHLLP